MTVDSPILTDLTAVIAAELPLGTVRPSGWLLRQLRLQADGISGRLEDVWADVGPESGWLGGTGEDWERGPYYLDGLVPLAWVLNDPALIEKTRPWLEWMLQSQDHTGFFGPGTNRDWWPRMVAVKVLEQYADATADPRVEPFLHRWFRHQLQELPGRPLTSWGAARGADAALGVWWLYRRTGESWLLTLMALLLEQTTDWDGYLSERLITGPAKVFDHRTHGPNVAMGLKAGAVRSLLENAVQRADRRDQAERSLTNLERWHGQPHGVFSGDEWLGGRAATAGVETCQVVELLYSYETLSQIFGDGSWGDRIEEAAFALLPASSDPEMRGHQYLQQANQVQASVGWRPWTHSSDDANIFGLEPHFGCCTANLHQGWPKLVRSAWVQDSDDVLRVVTWLPCTVEASLGGRQVQLDVETEYPFEERIVVRVQLGQDVTADGALRLRVPGWAIGARLQVNGTPVAVTPVDGYLDVRRQWRSGDEVRLDLPMQVRISRREGQSAVARLGPLVLALQVPENWVAVSGAPGIGEWEVRPRTSWNLALAETTPAHGWAIHRRTVEDVPFRGDRPPVAIPVRVAHVHEWQMDGQQAGPVPESPVLQIGPVVEAVLVPYGSARLRVTEFPLTADAIQALDPSDQT